MCHVGCGTGYYSAILAELVGSTAIESRGSVGCTVMISACPDYHGDSRQQTWCFSLHVVPPVKSALGIIVCAIAALQSDTAEPEGENRPYGLADESLRLNDLDQ